MAVAAKDDNHKSSYFHHPLVADAIGAIFGKLPDVLEPALRNPHHRQFFHSFASLEMVGWGMYRVYQWKHQDELEKWLCGCFFQAGGIDAAAPGGQSCQFFVAQGMVMLFPGGLPLRGQDRQCTCTLAPDGVQQFEIAVGQLQVACDLFADAPFGQKIGEEAMCRCRLGRKLTALQFYGPNYRRVR